MKLHKKGSRNILFFYLRKLSRLRGQFCSTSLVQSNIWHKKCHLLTQNWPLNREQFLKKKKKNISRSFFMQFYATKNLKWHFLKKRPKSIMLTGQWSKTIFITTITTILNIILLLLQSISCTFGLKCNLWRKQRQKVVHKNVS